MTGWRTPMATMKKGITVRATEWWRHLRWAKRAFWKRQRKAFQHETRQETTEVQTPYRKNVWRDF